MAAADVIVIGGGLIGCAVARELARSGVRVLMLERRAIGAEASGAAAGTLAAQAEADAPGPLVDLCLRGRSLFADFLEQLAAETGIDCEYGTGGILYCVLGDADEDVLARRLRWQQAADLRAIRLTREQARGMQPELGDGVRWAVHFPDDHWLDPRRLATAVGAGAEAAGVEIVCPRTAVRIVAENGRVTGVGCDGATYPTSCVVNAAGSWAGLVGVPQRVRPLPLAPLRGQMVAIDGRLAVAGHAIYSTKGYLVPRRDGRVLAGSTYERAGYETEVTVGGMAKILAAATALLPVLAERAVLETWAGLRPVTPDGLPVLGPSPDIAGLYYATGHGRNGILLAPLTARLIADLIVAGTSPEALGPFLPGRFAAEAA
jgi:glycine oxidase